MLSIGISDDHRGTCPAAVFFWNFTHALLYLASLVSGAEYIRELAETVECQKAEMEALQEEAEALQRDLQ